MSNHQLHDQQQRDQDIPRFDPWLRVLASSVIPVVLALYVHHRFLIPAVVAAVVLFLAGLVMLRRDTVRRRLKAQTPSLPGAQSVARSIDGEPLEMEGAEP